MKHIYLLGATGSIGSQTLDIIKNQPDDFKLKAISGYSDFEGLLEITKTFKPEFVAVKDESDQKRMLEVYPDIEVGYGQEGLNQLATFSPEDKDGYLVNALVGMVGLEPTIKAIEIQRDILLANKETLIVGGHLINDLKKHYDFKLYPIDSEHNALWQMLNQEDHKDIKRLIITASGGSFRDLTRDQLKDVTVEDALKHPNWSMGKKITIDSATMMNKGFEIIEACFLFDVDIDRVDAIIHKESLVHSMVEFVDSTILAHLSEPDMHLPIAYVLNYPRRKPTSLKPLDIMKMNHLSFEPIDMDRYPCLAYAKQAFRQGGSMRTVLNAANEAAVDLFLKEKIKFTDIEKIIQSMMDQHQVVKHPSLDQIKEIDKSIKTMIYQQYS